MAASRVRVCVCVCVCVFGAPRERSTARKAFPPRPVGEGGETKKASGPAKMTIFVQNIDFAQIIEKHKETYGVCLPRWPQARPRWPKNIPRWLQNQPKPPQDHPRPSQDATKTAQDRPKTTQDWLKWAQETPKTSQDEDFYSKHWCFKMY